MDSRSLGTNVGLSLFALAVGVGVAYALSEGPLPAASGASSAALSPATTAATSPPVAGTPSPGTSEVLASTAPSAAPVKALLLRSDTTPAAHVLAAGKALGWKLSGSLIGGTTNLRGWQVIVVQAGQDDQQEVLDTVRRVREAAATVRLVVVAPLEPAGGATELAEAVRAVDAELLDPTALDWVEDRATVFTAGGGLTPEGASSVGAKLADALSG